MLNILEQKIFIVDDEVLINKLLCRALQNLGYEDVQTFANGTDCINALSDEPFIILLDYEMEGLNGFDVLKKIKRYNPNTYVIMISSQDDVSNAVDTLKFGAFDYIVKGDSDMSRLKLALERIYKIEEQVLVPRKSLFTKIFNLF
jgi:DNA-binding NtrC family response regulator